MIELLKLLLKRASVIMLLWLLHPNSTLKILQFLRDRILLNRVGVLIAQLHFEGVSEIVILDVLFGSCTSLQFRFLWLLNSVCLAIFLCLIFFYGAISQFLLLYRTLRIYRGRWTLYWHVHIRRHTSLVLFKLLDFISNWFLLFGVFFYYFTQRFYTKGHSLSEPLLQLL